jgi:hypothetical protein
MIQALITFAILFVFIRWLWKVWGKPYSTNLGKELTQEDFDRRDSLKIKIEALKKEAQELRDSDDELKTSKMIEELQTQRLEKEAELKDIEERITRN